MNAPTSYMLSILTAFEKILSKEGKDAVCSDQ
jgi:hypothetical protein